GGKPAAGECPGRPEAVYWRNPPDERWAGLHRLPYRTRGRVPAGWEPGSGFNACNPALRRGRPGEQSRSNQLPDHGGLVPEPSADRSGAGRPDRILPVERYAGLHARIQPHKPDVRIGCRRRPDPVRNDGHFLASAARKPVISSAEKLEPG